MLRVIVFILHFLGACLITFGVWFRCDQDRYVSRMYVDSTTPQPNMSSYGLYLEGFSSNDVRTCYQDPIPENATRNCQTLGLPLYDNQLDRLGWHPFALLGHFEWISSAFALLYVLQDWRPSAVMALAGGILFSPWNISDVFINEVLLMWVNTICTMATCWSVQQVCFWRRTDITFLNTYFATSVRFAEYCITASELYVAVLCVFVTDAPAYMSALGYTSILVCNLCGIFIHLCVVYQYYDAQKCESQAATTATDSYVVVANINKQASLRVPRRWLAGDSEYVVVTDENSMTTTPDVCDVKVWWMFPNLNFDWCDPASLCNLGILDAWVAFTMAMALILYQGIAFLLSTDAPWYVVWSGWWLLASYTSFGLWCTLLYFAPQWISFAFCNTQVYSLMDTGLDVLSAVAKLSIVAFLSFGFVFMGGGC